MRALRVRHGRAEYADLRRRGYIRENVAERFYRELRVERIWEGTSEIQRLIVGNEVAKRGLDGVLSFGTSAARAGAAA
jgi:butyryl-CoA dehydrogenase